MKKITLVILATLVLTGCVLDTLREQTQIKQDLIFQIDGNNF